MIGDVVHYVSMGSPIDPLTGDQEYPSLCRAATVTEVDAYEPDRLGLCVFNPAGVFFHSLRDGGALLDLGPGDGHAFIGGTWHYPEHIPNTYNTPGA